jgi:hypothetical protein
VRGFSSLISDVVGDDDTKRRESDLAVRQAQTESTRYAFIVILFDTIQYNTIQCNLM